MSGQEGGVWIIGEERRDEVHPVTYELLAWGREVAAPLGSSVGCVILGAHTHRAAEPLIRRGADRVIAVEHSQLAESQTEAHVRILRRILDDEAPAVVLSSASTLGRTVMPILAIHLDTGLTADCTGLAVDPQDGCLLQTRPAIGGNVLATIKTPHHRPQMATVRPRSRTPLAEDPRRSGEIACIQPKEDDLACRIRRVGFEPDPGGDQPLEDADVVVSGGKGVGRADAFGLVDELAGLLDGVSGASRVAVDLGWAPYARQVGLSGRSVRPKLYMALGISGSPNHLAGMSTSERIIAVNRDPNADIFRVADFGVVGDVHEVIPALLRRLRAEKERC
jgi:electron transfer flavoprotein alpha subunit